MSLSRAAPPLGIVHGRFQPFHNEHLAYLRLAAARSEELVVGITDPAREGVLEEAWDSRRHRPEQNPFTYWERMLMIEAVLESEELDGRIVPFPISHPDRLRQYVPARGTHYLRVFDAWGEEKVRRLRALGHDVVVLEPGTQKALSASDVRALMRDGGAWQDLVPAAVARVVEGLRHEADRRPPA